ncbi:MAG: hypothetical protein M1818_001255 [Claussenomyces sp. TS43310]|nr:MAG: hypothetical protein M1818_001255 [Claussenomyces sp. TS43310]
MLFKNTARPLEVPSYTEAADFHKLFTGPNLRLEIIGVLCAIAARSCVFRLGEDVFDGNHATLSAAQFKEEMVRASDSCVEACKTVCSGNDIYLWLLHESVLLSGRMWGDSSPLVWSKLGELSTEIYSFGIHREPKDSADIPIFLLESRRKLFAASYQLDKSVATFLGRPPRICWRYADRKLPLDLSDESMTASTSAFQHACQSLNAEGWATEGTYHRAGWIRVRYIMGTYREEVLEMSLETVSSHSIERLKWVA